LVVDERKWLCTNICFAQVNHIVLVIRMATMLVKKCMPCRDLTFFPLNW